ncbi:hypothetical protein TNCV_3972041 [Trichonephila clavipes]|nr:hypothetical protein TNCV_3972041 [Trichonephila clavipes]
MPTGQVPPRACSVAAVVRNGNSIPSPVACEVRSVISILNAQSRAHVENSSSSLSGLWAEHHEMAAAVRRRCKQFSEVVTRVSMMKRGE